MCDKERQIETERERDKERQSKTKVAGRETCQQNCNLWLVQKKLSIASSYNLTSSMSFLN